MTVEISKIVFSCFEAFLYLLCINIILPRSSRVGLKESLLQFFVITFSAYLFLNNNIFSILIFNSIIIFIIYMLNRVDVYVASISALILYITTLIASLVSIVFGIFIYNEKLDYRFLLTDDNYQVFILKFVLTIFTLYIYKIFMSLFNRKLKIQKINPRPVIIVNTIYTILLVFFTCEMIQYIPKIYLDVLKVDSIVYILYSGVPIIYISSLIILYFINKYLFKSSDYISIKLSSETDAMTGVLNRKAGLNYLKQKMQRIQLKKGQLTICFIDVNNLKSVNDKYGHKEGDKLINSVSKLVSKSLRDGDNIARLGGDEFLITFDHCSITQAILAWERIEERISNFNFTSTYPYDLSVSVGFSEYTHNTDISHDMLVELADAEMYKNKEAFKKLKGNRQNERW